MANFYYFIIQDKQDFYNFQNISDSDITKRINFDNNLTDQYKFVNSCVINIARVFIVTI